MPAFVALLGMGTSGGALEASLKFSLSTPQSFSSSDYLASGQATLVVSNMFKEVSNMPPSGRQENSAFEMLQYNVQIR